MVNVPCHKSSLQKFSWPVHNIFAQKAKPPNHTHNLLQLCKRNPQNFFILKILYPVVSLVPFFKTFFIKAK